jgi:hypothetical protein
METLTEPKINYLLVSVDVIFAFKHSHIMFEHPPPELSKILEQVSVRPGSRELLRVMKVTGKKMIFTARGSNTVRILRLFGLYEMFDYCLISSNNTFAKRIKKKRNINPSEILLFDRYCGEKFCIKWIQVDSAEQAWSDYLSSDYIIPPPGM